MKCFVCKEPMLGDDSRPAYKIVTGTVVNSAFAPDTKPFWGIEPVRYLCWYCSDLMPQE